jgi:hypothetical protein
MSTSTEYMAGMNAPIERRFYPRVTPPTPIYVAFGSSNLGVLHNVSENGFQVTTPESLPVNSVFKVFLTLTGASKSISVSVRTIWTEETQKRSGIQLLDLAELDRHQIRDWVELETSQNENAGPNEWSPPNRTDEQPVAGEVSRQSFSQQSSAPRRSANERAQAPPPVTPSQPAAAFAGASDPAESSPYANLFAAATNPEEFPPVPLPIHRDFVYEPPAESTRSRSLRSRYARWRSKRLVMWATALAIVCFAANALVKRKIAINSQHYAAESARNGSAPAAHDADAGNAVASAENSAVPSAATNPVADSNSGGINPTIPNNRATKGATSDTQNQPADTQDYPRTAPATDSVLTAHTSAPLKPASPRSQASTLDSNPAQAPQSSSSDSTTQPSPARASAAAFDAARNRDRLREYLAATAPPPAAEANDSANVTRGANSNPSRESAQAPPSRLQSPAPSISTPSASTTTASAASNPPTPSTSAPPPVRTQTPPPVINSQPPPQASNPSANNTVATNRASSSASSTRPATNPTNSNPSAIYNANGNSSTQKSAILGSINSVHSSGIFAAANSPAGPPPVSPDNSPSPYAAAPRTNSTNSYVAARTAPVNSDTVQMDTPQDRDIEIPAPKGFNASYVEIPGEHTVRSPSATIHIQRSVRVPGERVPGQRWLWRGHMNVTLGELVTRVDPSVAQSAGSSGSLTVEASIDKDGYVTDLKPLYGNFSMLPAVSRAVRSWRYQPTYLDNKRAETQAKIEFDLHPPSTTNRASRQ